MAKNNRNRKQNQSARGNRGSNRGSNRGQGGDMALDNLTYNIITVLHEKSKGLEAFEQYVRDAQGNEEVVQIFEEMRDADRQNIQRLERALRNQIGGGGEMDMEEEEEDAA